MTTLKNSNLTFNAKTSYYWLLALIWCRSTFFTFIIQIFKRLPIIGMFADFIYPLLVCLFALLAIPYMAKRIKKPDVIAFLIVLAMLCWSFLVYPNSAAYLEPQMLNLISLMLLFFVGISFDLDGMKQILFWISLIGIASSLFYQLYGITSGRELLFDNMGAAYNVLPSIMYLIYYAFTKKKIKYWILAGFSFLFCFSFGSRGPILCALLFFLVGLYVTIFHFRSGYYKAIYLLISVIIIGFLSMNGLSNVVEKISDFFARIGFSTRIFDYFLEGNIADDSGRELLQQNVLAALFERPIMGYGIMGDRSLLNGIYVHNIILETLCHFGLIVGTVLLAGLMILLIKAVIKSRTVFEMLFIVMIIIMVIVKLMLSSSYLVEKWFYFMLGLATCYIRQKGNKNEGTQHEKLA